MNPRLPLLALLCGLASGCLASSVLDPGARDVQQSEPEVEWRPATSENLPGLWRTVRIEGPAAAVLLDLTYWIAADGTFSGAALFAGPPPRYEVLSGRWTLAADGTLLLGEDSGPARAEVGQNLLRLSGDEGSLILEPAQLR